MRDELLTSLLTRALTETLGLVVTTNNPNALAQSLHRLSRANPKFSTLIITVPSTPETVIIAQRCIELDTFGEPVP